MSSPQKFKASSVVSHSTSKSAHGEIVLRDPPLRTLADVRGQVAREVAARAISKAQLIDGEHILFLFRAYQPKLHIDVKISVMMSYSKSDDAGFLSQVAQMIAEQLRMHTHLFAVATTGSTTDGEPNYVVLCSSSADFVQRAVLLTSAKFVGRIDSVYNEENMWIAGIRDIGTSTYDEAALWDVVRKSARIPIDPLVPPPGSRGIDQILSDARAQLQRLTPIEAYAELQEPEVHAPTFLVDIRPAAQREREGAIHGSLIIERNVLEWRFDPRCDSRLNIADRYDLRIIVFCQEGFTSSLAAYALQEMGLLNATDIIGGLKAWREAGLPVDLPDQRSLVSRAGSIV